MALVGAFVSSPQFSAICEEWDIQAMAGMPQAMISVVCPRGCVAMEVQPVAVTTGAPVSAPEDGPNGLEELNPEFFPVDVQFHDDSLGVGVLLVDSLSGLRVGDKGQRTTDKGFRLADVSRS